MRFLENRCLLCNKIIPMEKICDECKTQIKEYSYDIKLPKYVDGLAISFVYENLGRQLILDYKLKGKREAKEVIGRYLIDTLIKSNFNLEATLTYVPMTKKSLAKRGFNQTEELAYFIADQLDMKVENIFNKKVDTKDQVGLDFFERQKNLKDVFEVINYTENIIIVDDVFTTGTTISTLCKVAKEYGIKNTAAIVAAAGY